jgi:hypothetical protein
MFFVFSDSLTYEGDRGIITLTYPTTSLRFQSLEELAESHGGMEDVLLIGRSISTKKEGNKSRRKRGTNGNENYIFFTARANDRAWNTAYKMFISENGGLEFREITSDEFRMLQNCSCYVEWFYK